MSFTFISLLVFIYFLSTSFTYLWPISVNSSKNCLHPCSISSSSVSIFPIISLMLFNFGSLNRIFLKYKSTFNYIHHHDYQRQAFIHFCSFHLYFNSICLFYFSVHMLGYFLIVTTLPFFIHVNIIPFCSVVFDQFI